MFIKKQARKCLLKIPFWREIDSHVLFFNSSCKNLKRRQHSYTDTSWNYLLLNIVVWRGCISRRGRSRGGEGDTMMRNLCLISHRWYDVEKLTVSGGSNLNLSISGELQKVLCWKDEKFKIQTHRGVRGGRRWLFL